MVDKTDISKIPQEELEKICGDVEEEKIEVPPEIVRQIREALKMAGEAMHRLQEQDPEFYAIHTDPEKRREFAVTLTAADISFLPDIPQKIVEAFESGTDTDKIEAFLFLSPKQVKEILEHKKGKKTYRTRSRAGEVVSMPQSLAVPTLSTMQYALSLCQAENAYIQPLTSTEGLTIENGVIYFDRIRPLSEAELMNLKTREYVDTIDLGLLRVFYNIYLSEFQKSGYTEIKDNITVYLKDLQRYMGKEITTNERNVTEIIGKIRTFKDIVGVMKSQYGNSYYTLLNFNSYEAKDNTISFNSPYLTKVVTKIYELSIRTNSKGKPLLKKDGKPKTEAANTYLIKPELGKERNKLAAESVVIIVQVIERAGNGIPNISAKALVERNIQLQQALSNNQNPHRLLKKTFETTWDYLARDTTLKEKYPTIKLPEKKKDSKTGKMKYPPEWIPTPSLEEIFKFPHTNKKDTLAD